jgi:hypothetical protein
MAVGKRRFTLNRESYKYGLLTFFSFCILIINPQVFDTGNSYELHRCYRTVSILQQVTNIHQQLSLDLVQLSIELELNIAVRSCNPLGYRPWHTTYPM